MTDSQLWSAYIDTVFDVSHGISFPNYAIITAWNPLSIPVSYVKNQEYNMELLRDLTRFQYFPLLAGDREFQWVEESFAVNMTLEDALALGEKHSQNAIYYVSDGELYLYSCIDKRSSHLGPFKDRIIKKP
ncbi:DUF3293 domain-containing protein [Vibrio sp.]|nr:DUF3293 domain-containing protein [Vibrio sp.]